MLDTANKMSDTAGGLTEDELEHHNYHCPDRGGTAA